METGNWWSCLQETFGYLCFQANQEKLQLPMNKALFAELKNLKTTLEPTEGNECYVVSVCVLIY